LCPTPKPMCFLAWKRLMAILSPSHRPIGENFRAEVRPPVPNPSIRYSSSFFFQYWGLNSGSFLLDRCSTTWAMPTALFCFSYFSDRILSFCLEWVLNYNSFTYAFFVAWITGMGHYAWLIAAFNVSRLLCWIPLPRPQKTRFWFDWFGMEPRYWIFYFWWWYWGLNSKSLTLASQVPYHLSHSVSPVLCCFFFSTCTWVFIAALIITDKKWR
jgi:hypothetical protein